MAAGQSCTLAVCSVKRARPRASLPVWSQRLLQHHLRRRAAASQAALMCWVTQSRSGRCKCSVTDHPGAQRHGQEEARRRCRLLWKVRTVCGGADTSQQIQQQAALVEFLLSRAAGR